MKKVVVSTSNFTRELLEKAHREIQGKKKQQSNKR